MSRNAGPRRPRVNLAPLPITALTDQSTAALEASAGRRPLACFLTEIPADPPQAA